MKLLEGKWALVTGSSRGIGQQIALGLAERKCNIVVHGRELTNVGETLDQLRPYEIDVVAVAGDFSTAAGVQTVIESVNKEPGRVDILYNNAAIQNAWKEMWDISLEEWQETFQINFFAMVALCNAFAPEMVRRGYGRIINLTSGIKDIPQLSPYSVSKAAVDKYTEDLAAKLKGTNVLANRLDPGWLRTDLGGPDGMFEVTTVLPGALVPALLNDDGPTGRLFAAQDFKVLER